MTVEIFPWRAEWSGGRLADVFHAESDSALDCMQVGAYDWQAGRLVETVTVESLRARLAEWIEESGADYSRELPYL